MKNSRVNFLERIKEVNPDVFNALVNRQKQLVDAQIYSVKDVSAVVTTDMFRDADTKVVASSGNINGGKLEKDQYFLLEGIMLLEGLAAGATDADTEATVFTTITAVTANGEFKLTANGSDIIPSMSCQAFVTTGDDSVRDGLLILDNPKMLTPQQMIEMEVKWGIGNAKAANTKLKVVLIGTMASKN